jgi:large subunit ribosomal protein L25
LPFGPGSRHNALSPFVEESFVMEQVNLRAETGRSPGSRSSRRLRRTGRVPAVVYGRGLSPLSVAVESRELYGVLHTEAGLNAIINLQVDGDEYLTVAREVQRDPVRGEITHLDLVQISLDESIQAEVSIDFVGDPAGRVEGGVVETLRNVVLIEALPMAIPSSITIDISELGIGDSASIADLPQLEGVSYVDDPETTLVTVTVPARVVVEEEVEELEAAELEGEEEAEAGAEAEDAEPEGDA